MSGNVYSMEAANLFCGKGADQSESKHLQLTELQLPGLEETYADHRPGGAPVAVEIDTGINHLECTFMLLGWSPDVASLFRSWAADDNFFTAYGLIRDRQNGVALKGVSRMKGRLGRSAIQNYTRASPTHWGYSIRGITQYELLLNGEQIYYWDFFTNTLIIDGTDRNAELNATLSTGSFVV